MSGKNNVGRKKSSAMKGAAEAWIYRCINLDRKPATKKTAKGRATTGDGECMVPDTKDV